MTNEYYMQMALELAKKGVGFVNPNPLVGAVIVKNGEIIGSGYHEKYGDTHAERSAIANCSVSPKGATLYVTLEPCCHYGKTPPCTHAIIQSGISKVMVGIRDPNPLIAGKGISMLKNEGIKVAEGVLQEQCRSINEIFFHYIQTKIPYVVMKYAMTMDGKIAASEGKSKWITGEIARHKVRQDRNRCSAIMVGVGTVVADDPLLTCRIEGGRNPTRIICDTNLRTPLHAKIVTTARNVPTIFATACMDVQRHQDYADAGCRIITLSRKGGHIDLSELMMQLGSEKIDSILLEGGGTMNWAMLEAGFVNKVQAYIAPKLFGGLHAKTPLAGLGIKNPDQAIILKNTTINLLGDDILIESEVKKCSQVL